LATTAHTFIIALIGCVRPNPAASIFQAVRVNQRVVQSGRYWAKLHGGGASLLLETLAEKASILNH